MRGTLNQMHLIFTSALLVTTSVALAHQAVLNHEPAYNADFQPASWMGDNLKTLHGHSLYNICLPGSHDAGMYTITAHTGGPFFKDCTTQTQYWPIFRQLQLGMRYFDIRPVIGPGGDYFAGHYSSIEGSWQGGNGAPIKAIVDDLNNFTTNGNCSELIIINLSHDYNTDVGNRNYRNFNQSEWNVLLQYLNSSVHALWTSPQPDNDNQWINLLPIDLFIAAGPAVVFVVNPGAGFNTISLGPYSQRGFFYPWQMDTYNSYSDTNNVNHMISDQLQKMQRNNTPPYFLLSWTLTQELDDVLLCRTVNDPYSIIGLASQAHDRASLVLNYVNPYFPNIFYIDAIADDLVTAYSWNITQTMINTRGN